MTDTDWRGVIRLVVSVLALALASIPAALDRAEVAEAQGLWGILVNRETATQQQD